MKVKINENEYIELSKDDNPLYESDEEREDLEDTLEFSLRELNNEDVELPVDDNPIYETDADNRDLEDTMEYKFGELSDE